MTSTGTFRPVRKANTKTRLDRDTWAGPSMVVTAYDVIGTGETLTEIIPFGTVFENPPFFAYGTELQPGENLLDGDYPFVTCGVASWDTTTTDETSPHVPVYYLGAIIWINIVAATQYRFRFRFAFEGTSFRNVGEFQ